MRRPLVMMLAATGVGWPALGALAPPAAEAGAVVVTSSASRISSYPGMRRENFEGTRVDDGSILSCGLPTLSSATDEACFRSGALESGMRYRTVSGRADGLAAAGPEGGGFGNPSSVLVLNYGGPSDAFVLEPAVPVDTLGFHVRGFGGGTCSVTVRYADRSKATTINRPCPSSQTADAFVGIEADRLIDEVAITGPGYLTLDNVVFGRRPSNRITVGSPRQQPGAGTATLSVRVPGVGVTSVSGPAVVTRSLDSARARTLVLPVAAKGDARRTLLRTGRVTVTVRVRFVPNGGQARTVSKRVPLVHRR